MWTEHVLFSLLLEIWQPSSSILSPSYRSEYSTTCFGCCEFSSLIFVSFDFFHGLRACTWRTHKNTLSPTLQQALSVVQGLGFLRLGLLYLLQRSFLSLRFLWRIDLLFPRTRCCGTWLPYSRRGPLIAVHRLPNFADTGSQRWREQLPCRHLPLAFQGPSKQVVPPSARCLCLRLGYSCLQQEDTRSGVFVSSSKHHKPKH